MGYVVFGRSKQSLTFQLASQASSEGGRWKGEMRNNHSWPWLAAYSIQSTYEATKERPLDILSQTPRC